MKFKPLRLVSIVVRNFNYVTVLLAAMFVFTGCAGLQVKMGTKVYLAKLPVSTIQASQAAGQGIAPGEKSALIVKVTQPDGTVLMTEGKGQGKVLWKDLTVTPSVVGANKKGVVSLSRDPRISDGQVPHVTSRCPAILTCMPISTFPWNMTASSPRIFPATAAPVD